METNNKYKNLEQTCMRTIRAMETKIKAYQKELKEYGSVMQQANNVYRVMAQYQNELVALRNLVKQYEEFLHLSRRAHEANRAKHRGYVNRLANTSTFTPNPMYRKTPRPVTANPYFGVNITPRPATVTGVTRTNNRSFRVEKTRI